MSDNGSPDPTVLQRARDRVTWAVPEAVRVLFLIAAALLALGAALAPLVYLLRRVGVG